MKIILPLSVTLPRKKKDDRVWILNLNQYRNTHHMILNQAKTIYANYVKTSFSVMVTTGTLELLRPPLHFTYTVFPGSNRSFDLANVCSIIDKFTCDALVEIGVISDDKYKVIPAIDYRIGTTDKDNPRCELVIEPLTPQNLV